ncbi:MAG: hypothetical protein ABSD62_08160 [Candidatus Limnocylindrales bacterium]
MTESNDAPTPKRASRVAAKAATPAGPKPARSSRPGKQGVVAVAPEPTHRHPNLGLAPIDMTAGFPAAAAALRRNEAAIAARALEAAIAADPELQLRFDDAGLRQLLHDAEVLIERLAMCVAANDSRPMAEYAEWIGPTFRRRGVSLWDVAALCNGIRETATPKLGDDEAGALGRALDAAVEVLRKNGRLGGDGHKRNGLLKWLYRGV